MYNAINFVLEEQELHFINWSKFFSPSWLSNEAIYGMVATL